MIKKGKHILRPRVGHIKYLHCFPLYYSLIKNMHLDDMELVTGVPVALNNYILNEELDISPISSIEYYRNKDKYLLFPDLTVGSSGHVRSVILFSKVPIKKLDGEKIALVSSSSTSHVLLRIILKYGYGIKPEYISCEPDLKLMLNEAKAALLIGDKALEESFNNGLYSYDLGEEWRRLSGKKMVYALWCVRKKYAKENPELVEKVLSVLLKSSKYCRDNFNDIVEDVATCWKMFSTSFIKKYLSDLNYHLDDEAKEGLKYFSELAKESGWLKQNGDLKFFNYSESMDGFLKDRFSVSSAYRL